MDEIEIDFLQLEINKIDSLNLDSEDRCFFVLKGEIEDLYAFAFGYWIGGLL